MLVCVCARCACFDIYGAVLQAEDKKKMEAKRLQDLADSEKKLAELEAKMASGDLNNWGSKRPEKVRSVQRAAYAWWLTVELCCCGRWTPRRKRRKKERPSRRR